MRHLVLISVLFGLTACVGNGMENSYTAEYDRLAADCRDRGGILATTGTQSARPQNDNVCKITGQPSDRVVRRPG